MSSRKSQVIHHSSLPFQLVSLLLSGAVMTFQNAAVHCHALVSLRIFEPGMGANFFEPYLAHERLFGAVVQNAKEIDANKDGLINDEELTSWLDEMAKVNDLPKAAQRLKLCDANRDGELTFDEYTRCTYGVGEDQLLRTIAGDYHHGVQFMHSEQIRFDAADEDRNHRLSIKEMAMFLRPQHYSSMEEMQASMVLAMMDSNHDMAVTFDEFVSEESGGQKLPGLVDSAIDHFLHMDKNQDNQLTMDELKPWFTPFTKR